MYFNCYPSLSYPTIVSTISHDRAIISVSRLEHAMDAHAALEGTIAYLRSTMEITS